MTIRLAHGPQLDVTSPAWVVCEFCRVETHAIVRGGLARYIEHGCVSTDEWVGIVTNGSRLPGWHPLHECGLFCDGQDGASSQCAVSKRRGPPSIVEVVGELDG